MGVKSGVVQPYDASGNKLPMTNAVGQVCCAALGGRDHRHPPCCTPHLCSAAGRLVTATLPLQPQVMGFAMFFGGLGQFIAGVFEYQRRNSFGFVAFCCYGSFWMSVSLYYNLMQFGNGITSKDAAGNAIAGVVATKAYDGQIQSTAGAKMSAMWHAMWGIVVRALGMCLLLLHAHSACLPACLPVHCLTSAIISPACTFHPDLRTLPNSPRQTFLLWLCTFNLNVVTSLLFLSLAILFWLLAAAESTPSITKGSGGFGFFVAFLAFYGAPKALALGLLKLPSCAVARLPCTGCLA